MTEDRMDVLLRRLDVPAEPDATFVDLSLSAMLRAADQGLAPKCAEAPCAWCVTKP